MTDTETRAALTGLSAAEVAERVRDGRSNDYTDPTSRSLWSIIRANVFTLFNAIVLACFVVLLLVGRWQDALFGLSALANAFIGSIQEFRAKRALDRLQLVNLPEARVLRDGALADIPVAGLVLDDVLVVRAGDQLAADAEVLDSAGLELDESMLTGESDPVEKAVGDELLSGSIVVAGEGHARVARVGADSYANRFAREAKKFSLVGSELRTGINRVLKWMAWLIGPVGLIQLNAQMVAVGGWGPAIENGAWQQAVVATVASVIAMIPLGLVLITSIAFAVGAVKLSQREVLVQELAAVEGLARVDVICLDKTGTLTEGEIVFDAVHPIAASAGGSAIDGWERVLAWYGAQPDANATARCLAVPYPPTTGAGPATATQRIPFSSARKWSAVTLDQLPGAWVLGGPEMIFPTAPGAAPHPVLATSAELARTGRRTLLLAWSPTGITADSAAAQTKPEPLTPVVLLTFREKVRPDAKETLAYFAAQDVAVRVISGDNPQTVAAIAREVGLDAPEGFDARELPEDDAELAKILETHTVFGRVTPEQKKRMVVALRADALAIKEADIGIAMNSGSPATKAVARIVLLDGRFSHLPGVVAEGRRVIANIEKVSMLFLTKTTYATVLALAFGIMMVAFPFLPRQLAVSDGLTIGLPAFIFALLPNPQRYQPGFLRRSLTFAIPSGITLAAAITVYTRFAMATGADDSSIQSGALLLLTIGGLWVLIVLARPIELIRGLVIGAAGVGLILAFSVPIAADFLQIKDPGVELASMVLWLSIAVILGLEVVHFAVRRIDARVRARGLRSRAAAEPE